MDLQQFTQPEMGELIEVSGQGAVGRPWSHRAFVPAPLGTSEPTLSAATYRQVIRASRALATLDATARQLPDPTLLRAPVLRREAQATSALEGTYAPLADVMVADESAPSGAEMLEILNYVEMTRLGFRWVAQGRPLTSGLLEDLQGALMRGTPIAHESGYLRTTQVVIGRRTDAQHDMTAIEASRFVPCPPGDQLRQGVRELVDWIAAPHPEIDPLVATAMAHYQFETLHPFRDGNGRLGRYLIVLMLQSYGVLTEPTLTVSPWLEARRSEYYDVLLAVSTRGDWDSLICFLATGLESTATATRDRMLELVGVQERMHGVIHASTLRSSHALRLVDLAVANPTLTVKQVAAELSLSYGRANDLVSQLVSLGLLRELTSSSRTRRFIAPAVMDVLLSASWGA